MTENRNGLLFVVCHLFSVLCPLYFPETRHLKPENRNLMDDEYFMKKALEEAQTALVAGEFPVGCVVVHDKKILACGARKGTSGDFPNEVDHAELIALRRLFRLELTVNMREVTVFSTLEPCLMCFGALMISGVGKLVFAYEDPMGGGTQCDAAKLPPLYQSNQIAIVPGILRYESLKLLKAFFSEPENSYLRDSLLAAYTLGQ
jgi:tRNA(adenine34) deaminase